MPRRLFFFDPPDRFVAGTVGEPGQRTFFLQARKASQVVSVVLEKVQVAGPRRAARPAPRRARGAAASPSGRPPRARADTAPLDEPLIEAFRATTLTLGWDADAGRVLVEARAEPIEVEIEARRRTTTRTRPDRRRRGRGRGRRLRGDGGARRRHRRIDPGRVRGPRDDDEDDDDDLDGPDVLRVRRLGRRRRDRSWSARRGSSRRAGRRARCAASRSTPRDTSAREETGTTSISCVATTSTVAPGHRRVRWPVRSALTGV